MPQPLPDEILLELFRHANVRDLWLSLRLANKQFKACAEDVLSKDIVPHFTINLSFTLGNGTHHRWYDIRGSIVLTFTSISKHNPQYALFDKLTLLPDSCRQRSWEKWNQICSAGVGNGLEWRVQLADEASRIVKLPNLMISHEHGAWCDWKELLGAYFGKPCASDQNRIWTRQIV